MNPLYIDRVLRLVHSIFDFNEDRLIDELDAYCFYVTYEADNPELFLNIYYDDIIRIIERISKKKRDLGYENRDVELKLKRILKRLVMIRKAGKEALLFQQQQESEL
jgi:hypothetical protein